VELDKKLNAKRWFSPYCEQVGVPVAPAIMKARLGSIKRDSCSPLALFTETKPVAHKKEDIDFRESGERNNEIADEWAIAITTTGEYKSSLWCCLWLSLLSTQR